MSDALSSLQRAGKAWVWILVGLVVAAGGGVALWLILSNRVSSDFDLVPRDAQAFMTVRVADLLETDAVKEFLESIPENASVLNELRELESKAGLKRTDIQRFTVVLMDAEKQSAWALIHTKKQCDEDGIRELLNAEKEATHNGKTYYTDRRGHTAVYFPSSKLIVIASRQGMEDVLDLKGTGDGPLKEALKKASSSKNHIVAAVDVGKLMKLPDAREDVDAEVRRGREPDATALRTLLKLKTIVGVGKLGKGVEAEVVAEFEDADAAKHAADNFDAVVKYLRRHADPHFREALEPFTELLQKTKSSHSGSTATATLVVSKDDLDAAVARVHENARRAALFGKALRNLHEIGMALHHHNDALNALPIAASSYDQKGKPVGLSWRVHLLPYFEHEALYKEFKLDEPWDSEHNIKLLERMPKEYESPNLPAAKKGYTNMQAFTGPNTVFPPRPNAKQGQRIMNLSMITSRDGAANVIGVAQAARAVPWTAPEDIVVDQDDIKPKLAVVGDRLAVLFLDGSTRALRSSITERMLRLLIDPQDGQVVNWDD